MNPLSLSLASLLLLAPFADGWLGVYLVPDREQAVVAEVIPESPAARAGLQAGDELTQIGDRATPTRDEVIAAIRSHKAGARLPIKVRRDGKEIVVTVRLGERPETLPAPGSVPAPVPPKQNRPPQPAGETAPVVAAAPERKAYLGLRVRESARGVVVDEALAGGPAAALGIQVGERITSLGGRQVESLADLDVALQGREPGQKVVIGLQSDAGARSLTLALGAVPGAAPSRAPAAAAPPAEVRPAKSDAYDAEREIEALRRDLRELRQQLDEMRQKHAGAGREVGGRE